MLQFMGLQRIGHDWVTEQQKHHLGSSKNHFLMEVLLCVSVLIQMVWELKAGRRRCDIFHQRLYNKLLEKWQLAFMLPEHSNPLQYFCLENLMDRGAWWARVHRVTKSRTQLKQLSTCILLLTGVKSTGLKSESSRYFQPKQVVSLNKGVSICLNFLIFKMKR